MDDATEKLLLNRQSPSRKVGELDNRGSHFYLAMYWAQGLVNQAIDSDLSNKFSDIAIQLTNNKDKIIGELNDAQGSAVDLGGYYYPKDALSEKAMRPSKTLNSILASM